ncbi:MAG: Holliday junction branch migration protein RuvA [Pseudomonadota bacterium]
MIGRLRGTLIAKNPPSLLIECAGVGYEVEAPMTTIYEIGQLDGEVTLFTHLVVRDDAHLLFGFSSDSERRMFRALLKVSGIGARMALAILSGMDAKAFAECIHAGDTARLTAVPGVGKKTAERLIVEMRDRVADWQPQVSAVVNASSAPHSVSAGNPANDAISGLIALGYKPQEASKYVLAVDTEGLSSEAIIKEVLRTLVN